MSVTIGKVTYDVIGCGDCDHKESVAVVVDGRTVASSRGDIVRTGADGRPISTSFGTVSMKSTLFNTAAGGGNPALKHGLPDANGVVNPNVNPHRDGYAGYLVLENFEPGDVNRDGGVEHALGRGAADDQRYAVLRLATATGQPVLGARTKSDLNGWAGGLAEQENGAGAPLTILPIGSGTEPTNVRIQTDPETNRVQADMVLNNQLLTLGGLSSGPSAFIDDDRFAAGNDKVAMVTANLLRGNDGKLPASLNLPDGFPIPQYKHV
jgi:hypothetical protein